MNDEFDADRKLFLRVPVPVNEVRQRGEFALGQSLTGVIRARMHKEDIEFIDSVAERIGISVSSFVRQVVLSAAQVYVHEHDKEDKR